MDSDVALGLPRSSGTGPLSGGELSPQETLRVESGTTPKIKTDDGNGNEMIMRSKRRVAVQSDSVRKALLASGQI